MNLNFENNEALYAEVILPLPIKKVFTYRLPSEFFELAMEGKRVFVPFGARKVYTGIIYKITDQAPKTYEAINIISIIDNNPLISSRQMKFWEWIAEYYMCGLGDVMLAALPNGLRIASESFICLQPNAEYENLDLDDREILIINLLKGKEKLKIADIENQLKSKSSFVKIIKSLFDRDLISLFEDIGTEYKAKKETVVKLSAEIKEEDISELLKSLEKKAKSQFEVVMCLIALQNKPTIKSALIKQYQLKSTAFKALKDKGIIEETEQNTSRFNYELNNPKKALILSSIQQNALLEIENHFKTKDIVLFQGVTASGKTLVYIELIKKTIAFGSSVLVMVPEIALTEQLINMLQAEFGSTLMLTHSRFNFNEKVEIWNNIQTGAAKVLVGSRSSVFMPFPKLGLIIIDEEHENTFKQSEKAPRYNAKDAAIFLARKEGAKVLLGSATPSIESYYNAQIGKYGWVHLNEKHNNIQPSKIEILDIKEAERTKQMNGIFSDVLFTELKNLRENKSQAILFQNRKGYVPILECSVCSWVCKCINCDISLTYYKYSNNLRCHYCGYQHENFIKCQACGNNSMSMQGFGTERITEELQLLLPKLVVQRFDQDSTQKKHSFKNIIQAFEAQRIDVLVGTQIVVKGFDFQNVKIAAVLNADQLLNIPDFRSHERTFQLLIQLAGRVGRSGEQGVLYIQTKQATHPVLAAIQNYDLKSFYESQLQERETFGYPPFGRLIKITFKHKTQEMVNDAAAKYAQYIKKDLGNQVLGPEVPHVSKIRNLYIKNILIKKSLDNTKNIKIKKYLENMNDFLVQKEQYKALFFIVDVDCG